MDNVVRNLGEVAVPTVGMGGQHLSIDKLQIDHEPIHVYAGLRYLVLENLNSPQSNCDALWHNHGDRQTAAKDSSLQRMESRLLYMASSLPDGKP